MADLAYRLRDTIEKIIKAVHEAFAGGSAGAEDTAAIPIPVRHDR